MRLKTDQPVSILWKLSNGMQCMVVAVQDGWAMRITQGEVELAYAIFRDGSELLRNAAQFKAIALSRQALHAA